MISKPLFPGPGWISGEEMVNHNMAIGEPKLLVLFAKHGSIHLSYLYLRFFEDDSKFSEEVINNGIES